MMIEIKDSTWMYPFQMAEILATIPNYAGASTGWFGIIARLVADADQDDINNTIAVLDGYGLLGVITDQAVIAADDVEVATITATAGAGDTAIRFDVWDSAGDHAVDNEIVAVVGGVAEYQFDTALAEAYTIFAHGDVSYQTGSVEVVANE